MRFPHSTPSLAPRRRRTALLALCTAGALVLGTAPMARADDDAERESLVRISYELMRIQQMVADAGKRAPQGQRVQFRYDWLSRDLDLLRQGVEDHADAARQPRPVTPLRGDYRR